MPNKRIRMYDFGLFEYLLEEMPDTDTREYFLPWEASFPTSDKRMIGEGIPGIKRLDHFEDGIKDVDLFIFPDIYKGALQEDLRSRGKAVFGSGRSEMLEIDRSLFKDTLDKVGLPNVPTEIIEGVDELRKYLMELPKNAKLVIKSSCFRGDQETEVIDGKNNTVADALDWLDALSVKLGVRKEHIEFLCESSIDSDCEPGYDGVCSDGVFGSWGMVGYEKKDEALIGRMYRNEALPPILKNVNDKLSPEFKRLGYRGLYTIESRISKKGKCYPIDLCARGGSPSAEVLCKLIGNWPEVVWDVANGKPANIKPTAKFGAILKFTSEMLCKDFDLEVKFPKEIADSVVIYNKYQEGNKIYSISQDENPAVGAVVATGSSIDEVVDLCIKRIDQVHVKKMAYDEHVFDGIKESIHAGKKYGIVF